MRFLVLLAILLMAGMYGCTPITYFNTANNLVNQNCTVYLANGAEITGQLTIQFESGFQPEKSVRVVAPDHGVRNIPIDSIRFYKHNTDYYYPKEISFAAYSLPNWDYFYDPAKRNLLFVKRITPPGSRLDLFQFVQRRDRASDGRDHFVYFVSKATEHRYNAWDIGGTRFLPDFTAKMSWYISDCPALSQKITNREPAYTVDRITLDLEKLAIFRKIIDEYNNCTPVK